VGVLLAISLSGRPTIAAQSCGGETHQNVCNSATNPYPCTESCANGSNCTWWAWEAACRNWKIALPLWSWTNEWVDQAKLLPDLQVSTTTPSVNSIACKDTHVAWVIAVSADGATVTVTEQACNGPSGTLTNTHPTSWFNKGFISKKSTAVCSAGQTEPRACGACGTQSRTCAASGQWGSWGACLEGVCSDRGSSLDSAPARTDGGAGVKDGNASRDRGSSARPGEGCSVSSARSADGLVVLLLLLGFVGTRGRPRRS
jgi:surface antigen